MAYIKKGYDKKPNGKKATGRTLKRSEDWILKELDAMWEFITANPESEDILFIEELCLMRGYHKNNWNEWPKLYPNNQKLLGLLKKVESFLENKIVKAALKQDVNTTMAIFVLKNKYKWSDRTETDITTNGKDLPQTTMQIGYGPKRKD